VDINGLGDGSGLLTGNYGIAGGRAPRRVLGAVWFVLSMCGQQDHGQGGLGSVGLVLGCGLLTVVLSSISRFWPAVW
jgi:hypothetical protein